MGFLKNIFKGKNKEPVQIERAEVMSGGQAVFTPFSGNAYESDIYRSAVDAIARNAAKLKPTHIVTIDGQRSEGIGTLNRILQVNPNPFMTAYDVIYKLVTHYYLYNNAFAYLKKDKRGYLEAIYPLRPQQMEYVTDKTGELYCKFVFENGRELILGFGEVFTIRRFFNSNDLLGDKNTAIGSALELAHAQSQGMEHSIESSATIRGILKYNQVLSPEKLKSEKEAFIKDYLNVTNTGGVAVIDSKAEYIPLNSQSSSIDDKQLQAVKQKIYEYLGVSEKIVNSTYDENEWSAFYESVIEPIALQFSLELTRKIFTKREQAFGNSIMLESNRLQFASATTKTNLIFNLLPMGIMSINEAREVLNLSAIEGGDRYIQSLNYANKDIVDKYQMDDDKADEEGVKGNEGNEK